MPEIEQVWGSGTEEDTTVQKTPSLCVHRQEGGAPPAAEAHPAVCPYRDGSDSNTFMLKWAICLSEETGDSTPNCHFLGESMAMECCSSPVLN